MSRVLRSTFLSGLAVVGLSLTGCAPPIPLDLGAPGPSGSLSVEISGLPSGTGGRVRVMGPGGYSQSLAGSAQLSGLLVGAYRIIAEFVNTQDLTWIAQPSPDSVFIGAGATTTVSVSYTGRPLTTLNLRVLGTQLMQVTQSADGSVPMVAARDALLRVFVVADGPNGESPVVRVRLYSGGIPVDSVDVTRPTLGVPLSVDSTVLGGSWNALIPAGRMSAGLSYQVQLDPDDSISETNESDNRWPSTTGQQGIAVQGVPPLNVRFVPVRQSVNGLTGNISAANQAAFIETTRRIYPLSTVNVDLHALYTTHAPALDANDASGAWGQILNETSALQAAEGSSENYMSVVSTSYGSGIAGFGWVGAPAAVAWDKPGSAPGVIAHELGHNFGRFHAPCGSPSNPDLNFPYSGAFIGTWGIDLTALSLKAPTAIRDLMSYCHPEWISDYTYMGVLAFRGSSAGAQPGEPAPGLLVWGRILPDRLVLEPGFAVTAPARLPTRAGPNQLEGLDASSRRIFSLSFDGTVVEDVPGRDERQFAFVVPLSQADLGRIAGLRLVSNGMTALRVPAAGLRNALMDSTVSAALVGGELEVTWAREYPLAVIRDAGTGQILSLARDGSARVMAGAAGVRVDLSDGVSSAPGVTLRPAP